MTSKRRISPFVHLGICLLAIVAFQSANAQLLFTPGYIVDAKGDTIRGAIEKLDWYNTPERISFRDELGVAKELKPSDISAFSVADQNYLSVVAEMEVSPRSIDLLETSSTLNLEEVRIFLKEEVTGPYSLYSYRKDSYDHFYLKYDNNIQGLHYKYYKVVKPDGSDYLAENNRYRMQLDYLLSKECDQLSFDRVRYKSNDLKRVLYKYYECLGLTVDKTKSSQKGSVSFGVLGGLSYSSANHKISSVSTNPISDFSIENFDKGSHTSLKPFGGFYFELPLGGRSTTLVSEISYLAFSSDTEEETVSSIRSVKSRMKYENAMIRLALLARFRPFKEKRLSIQLGPTLSKNLNNQVTEIRDAEELLSGTQSNDIFLDYENLIDARDQNLYRSFGYGLQFSVGYQIDSYLIDIRFNRSEDIVDFVNISLNQTDVSLSVHKALWSSKTK